MLLCGLARRRGRANGAVVEPAGEIAGIVAALGEKEGARGAAPAAIAVHDVSLLRIELGHLRAQLVQGKIPAALDARRLVLVGEAHVEPKRTLTDHCRGLRVGHRGQGRLLDELVEVALGETHEPTVAKHRDGGVAPRFRDEGFLAEAVPFLELRELGRSAVARRLARHQAAARLDDVVVVTRGSLLDDYLTAVHLHRLHPGEDALDVRGRQTAEQVRAEHARHPVLALLLVVELGDLHVRPVVGEPIVGEKAIEKDLVDLEDLDGRLRAGGKLPWLELGQRVTGVGVAAAHLLHQLPIGNELEVALEEIKGEVVSVALLEDVATLTKLHYLAALNDLVLVLRGQAVYRNEIPDGIDELVAVGRHPGK